MLKFIFVPDNIAAQKDVWFLGDRALLDLFYVLPSMRREAKLKKSDPPYLYDQYNISAFTMGNSQISNFFTRILSSIVEVVNKNRLPRMIVSVIDMDMTLSIDRFNKPGVSNLIGKGVSWLTHTLEQLIETKKEDIYNIRQGALVSGEPKLVWLRAFWRPNYNQDVDTMRVKFNDILEETLVSRKNSYILGITSEKAWFDRNGNLTNQGKIKLWQNIDQQIKAFDRHEISLKPRPIVTESRHKGRLPTPLPKKSSKNSHSRNGKHY